MRELQFAEKSKHFIDQASDGNFTEAQRIISEMKTIFKERWDFLSFWQACLYASIGDHESAINELQMALEQGYWWNLDMLQSDPDLSALKNDHRFIGITQSCEEILKTSQESSRTMVQQFGNPQAETVVIILHWRGGAINDFSEYWLSRDIQEKYQLVFIQSSQPFGYHSYCWDDFNLAKKEILKCISSLEPSGKKMILAGASQGASVALQLALEEADLQSFMAVIPAIEDAKELEQYLVNTHLKKKKGFIVTGTKDPYYDPTIQCASLLNKKGIQTEIVIKEGLRHFFPADFKSIELKAIDYLTR